MKLHLQKSALIQPRTSRFSIGYSESSILKVQSSPYSMTGSSTLPELRTEAPARCFASSCEVATRRRELALASRDASEFQTRSDGARDKAETYAASCVVSRADLRSGLSVSSTVGPATRSLLRISRLGEEEGALCVTFTETEL